MEIYKYDFAFNYSLSPRREPALFDFKELNEITRERKTFEFIERRSKRQTKKWSAQ